MKASQKHHDIERMLAKYGGQRRAEAGEALQLHKAAREQLHAEVEARYGRGFVSAQESAENFARTLAWQQNVHRWWHALVPKIGFAGACFAAVLVVFSIAHREAGEPAAPAATSDFLDMTPLADAEEGAPAIVPEAATPMEDGREAIAAAPRTPAPLPGPEPAPPVAAPAGPPAAVAVKVSKPEVVMEPQPDPAEMLADAAPVAAKVMGGAPSFQAGRPAPKVSPAPTRPEPEAKARVFDGRMEIAPPVWQGKPARAIEVNLPESVVASTTVVAEPVAAPIAATPLRVEPATRPAPTMRAVAPQSAAPGPVESDVVPIATESRVVAPKKAEEKAAENPTAADYAGPLRRIRLVAASTQPVLRQFDVVLEKGTIAIRDQDGSIYRGRAGAEMGGAADFTARGTNRSLREPVAIEGRLIFGASAALNAAVRLGGDVPFRIEARER